MQRSKMNEQWKWSEEIMQIRGTRNNNPRVSVENSLAVSTLA